METYIYVYYTAVINLYQRRVILRTYIGGLTFMRHRQKEDRQNNNNKK